MGRSTLHSDHTDWQSLRVLQLLFSTHHIAVLDDSGSQLAEAVPSTGSEQRLSTIPKGSNESDAGAQTQSTTELVMTHNDGEVQQELQMLVEDWDTCGNICDNTTISSY